MASKPSNEALLPGTGAWVAQAQCRRVNAMINKDLFISALVKDRKIVRFDASVLIQRSGRHSVDWPNCELAHNLDWMPDV